MSNRAEATIESWKDLFTEASQNGSEFIQELLKRFAEPDVAWILRLDQEELKVQISNLRARIEAEPHLKNRLPLLGVPFAIKDNIDYGGVPTTAGCPAFAYTPDRSAFVVDRLVEAGALLLGKTNLDQFATGLVGVRSPYGPVPNSFNPEYISGGSSAGSASVTARGLVPFALGTDTAGSGRVPAGFNNLVGLKPTRGYFSTSGIVPACRSLDCVSVFSRTVADAKLLCEVLGQYDAADPFSRRCPDEALDRHYPARPRLGYPAQPRWFGDRNSERAFQTSLHRLSSMGAELVPVNFEPMHELASLLYSGPWVAERYLAIEEFIRVKADQMDPVVRSIIEPASGYTALDVFRSEYQRSALVKTMNEVWSSIDCLVVPTAPSIYTMAQVEAEPLKLNTQLGTYTNFVNLADWSVLAVPAGFREDQLPFGISFIGKPWDDWALLDLGERWYSHHPWTLGSSGQREASPLLNPVKSRHSAPREGKVRVAVVGAHLSGLPLNHQLTDRRGVLVETVSTAPLYRFYELPGSRPAKPGLVRGESGHSIVCELWDLPVETYGSFVAGIPSPLGIGTIVLEDGRNVQGFLCESWAVAGAKDISSFGGWKAFLSQSHP
jgi:allophanate hydrolase